ncbi:alpha/beta hydrolase [Uliginosibacterium sp. H1]|uniref:alpha/beta hydrolase n=1 Tax=Uliginosibacterium sp. H1 TaxID=3114757 RepID=UPI002E189122|nr:alpha/beta fold hydrolase [Uliginosibacterium sp. H1]
MRFSRAPFTRVPFARALFRRLSLFRLTVLLGLAAAISAGCVSLEEQQRKWIFQPSRDAWRGGMMAAEGMQDVWIEFDSRVDNAPAKLHALWHPADRADAPVLLYLHGARWDVRGSAGRMRRMQELGFSVLGVDYRGFGRSSGELPSEDTAYEDARQAWAWLAKNHPDRPRYVFGHSLGGAIAIDLAANVADLDGLIVEGTFTSIPAVVSSFKWGWLPVSPLITQRFDSASKIAKVKAPVLIVHGGNDSLIAPALGQALYDAAPARKKWLLVEGGSHHSTNTIGHGMYREAIAELFGWPGATVAGASLR